MKTIRSQTDLKSYKPPLLNFFANAKNSQTTFYKSNLNRKLGVRAPSFSLFQSLNYGRNFTISQVLPSRLVCAGAGDFSGIEPEKSRVFEKRHFSKTRLGSCLYLSAKCDLYALFGVFGGIEPPRTRDCGKLRFLQSLLETPLGVFPKP